MQKYAWKLHYEFDRKYWWAQGRRELTISFLKKHLFGFAERKILDVGCGPGVLLEELEKRGAKVYGLDVSSRSVKFCRSKGLSVKKGDARKIPFKNANFDAVLMIDVLEHIKEENKAIMESRRVLKKGGIVVILAPAFPALWSRRDERLGHVRRYTRKYLIKTLSKGGFKIKNSSYFVFFFSPFFSAQVLIKRLFGKDKLARIKTDLLLVPFFINRIFLSILRVENWLLKFIRLPFGVSLFAVAEKR